MTEEERAHLNLMTASRIKRIARGSGRTEKEVKEMIQEFQNRS